MPGGNQHKRHGLDAQIVLRVSPALKAKLAEAAQTATQPGHPITPSDVARAILEAHFIEPEPEPPS
jgi:hypothetical protein